MSWISVEDRLPPDYEEVMYYATFQNNMSREIMTGHREKGKWTNCCMFYNTCHLSPIVKVTHWQPLPDYPKVEGNE